MQNYKQSQFFAHNMLYIISFQILIFWTLAFNRRISSFSTVSLHAIPQKFLLILSPEVMMGRHALYDS